MSKLERLIAELCPNGVEYKALGDLGDFLGGLTGKSKDDFTDGNAKFITYRNIYSNPALKLDTDDSVKIAEGEKQRTLEYGDILFTGSSETPDECGISSVLTTKTEEKLYLNSFCFIFRFNNKDIMLPDFSKHLFRSNSLRCQIGKTASGVTRFNVSKKLMANVSIPLPPLPIQREIVRILDNFTELTTALTTELTARKKQYEYYQESLLSICADAPIVHTKDVLTDKFWLMPATPHYVSKGIPYITSKNVRNGKISFEDVKYITEADYAEISKNRAIKENDLLITMIGTIGEAAFVEEFTEFYGQNIYLLRFDEMKCLKKFFYYYLSSAKVKSSLISKKNRSSQGYIKAGSIENLLIPLPSIAKQERIISILDKFDTLTTDITTGLPAEIEARNKQYEYYRNKLLTFEEEGA